MGLQLAEVSKRVIRASASGNLALKFGTARLPVLMACLILEGSRALVADEVRAVELLHDEAIHILAETQLTPAVWASVVFLLPHGDAGRAAELVALSALLGLLNHLQADGAGEVLVESRGGLLGLKVLVRLDLGA